VWAGDEPPPDLFDGSDQAREQEEIEQRIPPNDLDAEGAVVSAVMVDPGALDKVNEFLKPEHFYSEAHRWFFEAARELAASGSAIDVVLVAGWLKAHGRLARAGGISYLTEVLNTAPAGANVAAYGQIVHKNWRARQTIKIG